MLHAYYPLYGPLLKSIQQFQGHPCTKEPWSRWPSTPGVVSLSWDFPQGKDHLSQLPIFCLMQSRIPLAFFGTTAHCWLMFYLLFNNTPTWDVDTRHRLKKHLNLTMIFFMYWSMRRKSLHYVHPPVKHYVLLKVFFGNIYVSYFILTKSILHPYQHRITVRDDSRKVSPNLQFTSEKVYFQINYTGCPD